MTLWQQSSIITYALLVHNWINAVRYYRNSGEEKYSRGWRGAPAKGVGRETGARVQIPLSPFSAYALKCIIKMDLKRFKKVLTNEDTRDNILKLIRNKRKLEKNHKKIKQKSSWQTENNMIKYQSCFWRKETTKNLDN